MNLPDSSDGWRRRAISACMFARDERAMNEERMKTAKATHPLAAEQDRIRLKAGETFALCLGNGDISDAAPDTGLYWQGTRFLTVQELGIAQGELIALTQSIADDGRRSVIDLTNGELSSTQGEIIPRMALHIRRSDTLGEQALTQTVTITSYHTAMLDLSIQLRVGADFRDIFEVRGLQRPQRGKIFPLTLTSDAALLRYSGLDHIQRKTRITLQPPADQASRSRGAMNGAVAETATFSWQVRLRPGETVRLAFGVRVMEVGAPLPLRPPRPRKHRSRTKAPAASQPALSSDNAFSNELWRRGLSDLAMMCVDSEDGRYPYGGVPWYVCPFGRDALITSMEFLPWAPDVARGTLAYLAEWQGTTRDAFTEEEPGKIMHELRRGELANCREIPYIPSFDTIDATPLFLIALERYISWSGDLAFLKRMWPHAQDAVRWMIDYGDRDGDGFLEYPIEFIGASTNQGWKDSPDSVSYASGALAQGPIALSEVQAYAYAAYESMASLARLLGSIELEAKWKARADTLRAAFLETFWWPEEQCYYLALDGRKQPCDVVSSNAGHALWSGIAPQSHADAIVERLMREDMYSGWGIRTLSTKSARYNPMSYHNGSIWPHDNAIIAAGFARYGHKDVAARLLTNLTEMSRYYAGARLPELLCGLPRAPSVAPTRYPVACAPQSWAAGAPFLMLAATLGLEASAAHDRLVAREPVLPEGVTSLNMTGLRIGQRRANLRIQRPESPHQPIIVMEESGVSDD